MAKVKKENQIFISYRRDDEPGTTGRIYDRLGKEFGKKVIFKDVNSIPAGEDVKPYIISAINKCKIVLVIIGEQWIKIKDEKGVPRIQAPDDYVRMEIEEAIRRKKLIIPLLINNTKMPREDKIPDSIKGLVSKNGVKIGHDPNFDFDIGNLIGKLEKYLKAQPSEAGVRSYSRYRQNIRPEQFDFFSPGILQMPTQTSQVGPHPIAPATKPSEPDTNERIKIKEASLV